MNARHIADVHYAVNPIHSYSRNEDRLRAGSKHANVRPGPVIRTHSPGVSTVRSVTNANETLGTVFTVHCSMNLTAIFQ